MLAIAPQRHLANVQWTMLLSHCLQCFSMGRKSPKTASFRGGNPGPHLVQGSFGLCKSTSQMQTWSSQPYCRHWRFMFAIVYYGMAPSPPQNCPFPCGDPDPHLIHGYLGPHTTNGISIGSAVTDRLIDRPTDRLTMPHVSSNGHMYIQCGLKINCD